jgi:hypothetical protein
MEPRNNYIEQRRFLTLSVIGESFVGDFNSLVNAVV